MPFNLRVTALRFALCGVAALSIPSASILRTVAQTQAQKPGDGAAAAEDRFERGKRLYQQGNAAGAIDELRPVAEGRKTDADAWYFLGLALSRAGRAKDARKAFEKTLKLRPDDALAHVGLAYSMLLLDKPRDAEREAGRARTLDPRLAEARYVLGAIRFRDENFRQAAEEAEEALRLKPEFPAAAFLDGDALLNIYTDESIGQSGKYTLVPADEEAERKAVPDKREAALEPLKARMREVADRLESFARAQPNNPEATQWREQAGSLRLYGRTGGQTIAVFRASEVTTKAIITVKPEPSFTEEARKDKVTGAVRLRAVLAADGHVRHVLVIKRLPGGLTEKCVEAARQIRFTPATLNGQPVSQFIMLEYNFSVY
jgi:Flp pilus assembly protein TadD